MPASHTLHAALEAALPRLAAQAGRRELARLADLAAGLPDTTVPGALAGALVVFTQERERVMRRAESDGQLLRAAAASGRGAVAARDLAERWPMPSGPAAGGRWWDASAIEDRIRRAVHRADQSWRFLATAVAASPLEALEPGRREELRRGAAAVVEDVAVRWPVRAAAVRLLGRLADVEDDAARQEIVGILAERLTDATDDPWVHAAALRAWTGHAAERAVEAGLDAALQAEPSSGAVAHPDRVFARARAVAVAGERGVLPLVRRHLEDPSEHVAMASAAALVHHGTAKDRARVLALVADPRRARIGAAGAVAALGAAGDLRAWEAVGHVVQEASGAVAEALLDLAVSAVDPDMAEPLGDAVASFWADAARHFARDADPDRARLGAVLAAWSELWVSPPLRAGWQALARWVSGASEGASRRFTSGPLSDLPEAVVLEILFVVAHERFDLSARPIGRMRDGVPAGGWRVRVGHPRRHALWRMVHEATHPRHDKRQAFHHTTDEIPDGPLVAWSGRLAEVVATEVPGRRVASPRALGWGEHLPLPANLLAASRFGGVTVRTPRGAVHIAPQGSASGWRAHRQYVALADRRGRLVGLAEDEAVSAWDEAVRAAGFDVRRSLVLPAAGWASWLGTAGSSGEQAPGELVALALGALGWFGFRRAQRDVQLRRWRAEIPLVVGGWGSRGKSSVERLKAAMFHGLGYEVLCKSTGCEAMILWAQPGAPATEIFLFRPRDKATILEQADVLRIAASLGAQVVLWECMALNPVYTRILQRQWVRDDLTTITNTYPDHEDVQGPSGRDVADTIAEFVPDAGELITSEHHMTPVLAEAAAQRGTGFRALRPADWVLLPRDILERFPYSAYDRNVALVAALGAQLDVPRDEALRAMADHVLLDLGAFKTYGPVDVEGRSLRFVNGMSANDRASFLSNWERADLGAHPVHAGLDEQLVVVLNNRADRLARQAMFARIAALDVAADHLVIIGTNVGPMGDAIREALRDELVPRLRQIGQGRDGATALRTLFSTRLRRTPLDARRMEAVLAEHRVDDTTADRWREEVAWLAALARGEIATDAAIEGFVGFLTRRVVEIPDPSVSGDAVLRHIAELAPDGADVTMLGCENIKGTGLDVVYRWVSVDRVIGWVSSLDAPTTAETRDALQAIAAYDGWGRYDARLAVGALRTFLDEGHAARRGVAEDTEAALGRAEAALRKKTDDVGGGRSGGRLAEQWARVKHDVDLVGSVRRRSAADALYRALARGRVGAARAAVVAQGLVDGEKGKV